MKAKYAITALKDQKLKIAQLEDLNDPFELRAFQLSGPEYRIKEGGFRKELHKSIGFLCFSSTWNDVKMWSHYADKHKGICLAFEARTSDEHFQRVRYKKAMQSAPSLNSLTESFARDLITTKSQEWEHEHEWRVFPTLQDPEWCEELGRNIERVPFGDILYVAEVFLGVRCSAEDEEEARQACAERPKVKFRRLGLAKDRFALV